MTRQFIQKSMVVTVTDTVGNTSPPATITVTFSGRAFPAA
jgi:hypothetical protein